MTSVAPAFRFGLLVALIVFAADQALKWYLLGPFALAGKGRVHLMPSVDLVLVWNRGISYGLFQQYGVGRWLLVAVSVAAIVVFTIWMLRAGNRFYAAALGLVIGGAAGNLLDRLVFGAVVDFMSLYWGDFEWYVFNIADAAIVAGVAGLLYDSIFRSHTRAANGA